jgi:hypothetical protein
VTSEVEEGCKEKHEGVDHKKCVGIGQALRGWRGKTNVAGSRQACCYSSRARAWLGGLAASKLAVP